MGEREIFTELTGREREPLQRVDQFATVIGRRGGKSKSIVTLATYIAGLCEATHWCPASAASWSVWPRSAGGPVRIINYDRGARPNENPATEVHTVAGFRDPLHKGEKRRRLRVRIENAISVAGFRVLECRLDRTAELAARPGVCSPRSDRGNPVAMLRTPHRFHDGGLPFPSTGRIRTARSASSHLEGGLMVFDLN